MARFHLNVFNRTGHALDEEGLMLEDLAEARIKALLGIRSIISSEASEGMIDLIGRIEVTDETGNILSVVPFVEAFEMHFPARL